MIDTYHSWQSADKEDDTSNASRKKRCCTARKSKILENIADVVQNCVNTTPSASHLSVRRIAQS